VVVTSSDQDGELLSVGERIGESDMVTKSDGLMDNDTEAESEKVSDKVHESGVAVPCSEMLFVEDQLVELVTWADSVLVLECEGSWVGLYVAVVVTEEEPDCE